MICNMPICNDSVAYEPPHGKSNNLHRQKQRRRSASSFAVTANLISAFVFATRIVQFLFYLNPKFQASSSFLCLYRPVCVGPVRKPHCWFSHETAHMSLYWLPLYLYMPVTDAPSVRCHFEALLQKTCMQTEWPEIVFIES